MAQKIELLVIHCTATPEGREVTADDIRKWHLSPPPAGRGWKQVGYTDIIHLNGDTTRLARNNEDDIVDAWEVTNGATGINSKSRHIVYAGGVAKDGKTAKDTRTYAQTDTLKDYILDFVKRFPRVKVAGHYHFAKKDCPSFNVESFCASIGVPPKNIYKK